MIASMTAFSAMNVAVRYLGDSYSPFQQVFLRSIFGFLFIAPLLIRNGSHLAFRSSRWGLHFVRALLTYGGVTTWFYALTVMPLVEAVSLHFVLPLFAMVLAMMILKEQVAAHRWIALAVGMVGVLVILRPGTAAIDIMAFVVLASALSYAGGDIAIKMLSKTESPLLIVFSMNMFLVVLSAIPAAFDWSPLKLADAPMIVFLGISGIAAHYCLTKSLAVADASVVVPMEFVRLPIMAVAGYVLFTEVPDSWTVLGAVIIFSGVYYVTWKERGHGAGH